MERINQPKTRPASLASILIATFFLAEIAGVRGFSSPEASTKNNTPHAVGEQAKRARKGTSLDSQGLRSTRLDGILTGEEGVNDIHRSDVFGFRKQQGQFSESTSTLQAPTRPRLDFASKVGQYFWTPPRGLPFTIDYAADRISELGGRTMHVAFFMSCDQGQRLLQRAQAGDAMRGFGHPNIRTYVLTTYGAAGCGFAGRQFFDPKLYPAAAPSVEQDYTELTLHLYQIYQGSGKRFVVSTWEGDNVLYCGSAFWYANNSRIAPGPDGVSRDAYGYPMPKDPSDPVGRSIPFRDYCNAIYPQMGIPSVDDGFEGYRSWLEARQRGIRQGRAEAAKLGLSGVEVYHAAEINVVHLLEHPLTADGRPLIEGGQPKRLKSLLRDVLPAMQDDLDFVCYSAYETTNLKSHDESLESLQGRVFRDLETIRQFAGTRNVIIGEFGYERRSATSPHGLTDEQVVKCTDGVINAALDWGAAAIFTWQMYDDRWGTFDSRGNLLPLGDYFRQRYTRR